MKTAREIGDETFKALAMRAIADRLPVPEAPVDLDMPADSSEESIRLARASGFHPVFVLEESSD